MPALGAVAGASAGFARAHDSAGADGDVGGRVAARWAQCGGKVAADVSDPGHLTSLVLYVTEVHFEDGTEWRPTVAVPGTPE